MMNNGVDIADSYLNGMSEEHEPYLNICVPCGYISCMSKHSFFVSSLWTYLYYCML